MTPKEKELVDFLKLVDVETYTQFEQRFWEASNKLVTEEELAYYYLNAPDSPYNNRKNKTYVRSRKESRNKKAATYPCHLPS